MSGPAISSSMQSAAATTNPSLGVFFGIEIDIPAVGIIPAKTLRLLDGAASLTFGGMTFVGLDGDYGAWAGLSGMIEESIGQASPKIKATFRGLSMNAIDQLCAPSVQGSPASLYYGFFNPATGAVIPTPVNWFAGATDVGHITATDQTLDVDVDIVSQSEWFFLQGEGARLNSAWHELFFGGETGFAFVDGVTHQIPWGMKGPRPDQVTLKPNYDYGPKIPNPTIGSL